MSSFSQLKSITRGCVCVLDITETTWWPRGSDRNTWRNLKILNGNLIPGVMKNCWNIDGLAGFWNKVTIHGFGEIGQVMRVTRAGQLHNETIRSNHCSWKTERHPDARKFPNNRWFHPITRQSPRLRKDKGRGRLYAHLLTEVRQHTQSPPTTATYAACKQRKD